MEQSPQTRQAINLVWGPSREERSANTTSDEYERGTPLSSLFTRPGTRPAAPTCHTRVTATGPFLQGPAGLGHYGSLALWQVISSQHSPLDAQAHCCSGATLLKLAWPSTECCLELDNKHAFKPC